MSSNAAKIIAAIAVLLTVVLAILGYRVSRQYAVDSQQVQQKVSSEPETPKILAVVAVKPLAAYIKIEKDAVVLGEVSVAPKDYYTSLEDVVGKEPLVDIDQGAPVTKRYFGEGNALSKSIPPGFQAISVEVTDVIGVGGFVRPGDIVDVLLYLGRRGDDIEAVQARVLLKDVRVLAYHELIVDRPEGLKDEEKTNRAASNRRQLTAVLAVAETEATRLMLGASMGELRLALHGVTPPGTEIASLPPERVIAGGLPANTDALKAVADKKVPDKAITAKQLSRIELPPSEKKKIVVRERVFIYRGSEIETVTP